MKTHHLTRNASGGFDQKSYYCSPMEFAIKHIPDGVPFRIFKEQIGIDSDVTEDFDALKENAEFYIVESAGGGGGGFIGKLLDPLGVTKYIMKIISPQSKAPSSSLANQQAESPNNSLTDRNNKPRPYERTYDICGTVQSIPNDLMTTYRKYSTSGSVIEYGFYDVGRGYLDTPADGVTDGDSLLRDISGSSAAVYGPYTSPNSGTPQLQIGDAITEPLFITVSSNEVDGQTLKAPNDLNASITGDGGTIASLSGTVGTITDASGDAAFDAYLKAGDTARLANVTLNDPGGPDPYLDGYYPVISVSEVDIVLDVSGNLSAWQVISPTVNQVNAADPAGNAAEIGPVDTVEKSFTDWITVSRIQCERLMANIAADNGMYKDDGGSSKKPASVTAEMQYQLIDSNGNVYGPVYSAQGTISGRSADATGVSIIAQLPTPSAVRVRLRRVTDLDLKFEGNVVDEIKFANLYGQTQDKTPNYGNRTTVHTARRQTPRATAVKQPQLKLIVTEKVQRYLGNGVFDTNWSNNTQAVQSLIRLLRDPVVGDLSLTAANMDKLLAVQDEVESYFNSPLAGQFCYTFDSYSTTTQDIISTIATAIFCNPYRKGHDILLDFERPRPGPEMVFTHRSKAPSGEKWTRQFNDKDAYDSVKFSYIDPDTNVKETITIPETGGIKTDTYDSKGIRNYQQAYWHAWRRFNKNSLNKVSVEFTAMEEGIFAVPGRAISVVKGSRVAPMDGYVVAVNGLVLTLSQPVTFTDGDDHSLILKKRDGSVQSVSVTPGSFNREVIMTEAPQEAIYTGNSALKTEFSFGSEQRHNGQMILVSTVEPSDDRTVKIKGMNYDPGYYAQDGVKPFGSGFSSGFDTGFS